MIRRIFSVIIFALLVFGCVSCTGGVEDSGLVIITVKNFHKVSDTLYRSAQPADDQWDELEALGIRSVISLRYFTPGPDDVGSAAIAAYALPWRTDKIDEDDLAAFLKLYNEAEKPVLVHCYHGSDRTGAAVAAYRVVFENYLPEEAADELVNGGFGHHEFVYRNIPKLIRNADYDSLKEKLTE